MGLCCSLRASSVVRSGSLSIRPTLASRDYIYGLSPKNIILKNTDLDHIGPTFVVYMCGQQLNSMVYPNFFNVRLLLCVHCASASKSIQLLKTTLGMIFLLEEKKQLCSMSSYQISVIIPPWFFLTTYKAQQSEIFLNNDHWQTLLMQLR